MSKRLASITTISLLLAGATTAEAQAQDPTQSWWYKHSGWSEPAYRYIDRGTRMPSLIVPRQYRPHYNAFKYGWKGGNYISRRYHTGDRLYNYLQRNWR